MLTVLSLNSSISNDRQAPAIHDQFAVDYGRFCGETGTPVVVTQNDNGRFAHDGIGSIVSTLLKYGANPKRRLISARHRSKWPGLKNEPRL
jgi:hypothetical protein